MLSAIVYIVGVRLSMVVDVSNDRSSFVHDRKDTEFRCGS